MTIQNIFMLQAKTFRLPKKVIQFLEEEAFKKNTSQGKILELLVEEHVNTQSSWTQTLEVLALDQESKKESLILAEEDYE